MTGLPTGGFDLSSLPMAPSPSSFSGLGRFDTGETQAAFSGGMQNTSAAFNIAQRQKLLDATYAAETAKNKAVLATLPAQTQADIAKNQQVVQTIPSDTDRIISGNRAATAGNTKLEAFTKSLPQNGIGFQVLGPGGTSSGGPITGSGPSPSGGQQGATETPSGTYSPVLGSLSQPSPVSSETSAAGSQNQTIQNAPAAQAPSGQPVQPRPPASSTAGQTPAGPLSSITSGMPSPFQPMYGGVLAFPSLNEGEKIMPIQPNYGSAYMMGQMFRQTTGSTFEDTGMRDQRGQPLYQEYKTNQFGLKEPFGQPRVADQFMGAGGPNAASGGALSGVGQPPPDASGTSTLPHTSAGTLQSTQSENLGYPVSEANNRGIPALTNNPVYGQAPKDAGKTIPKHQADAAKAQEEASTDWDTSNQALTKMGQALGLSQEVYTNPLAPGWLNKLLSGFDSKRNTLQAITSVLGVQNRPEGMQTRTNFEVQTLLHSAPGQMNTPQTNAALAAAAMTNLATEKEYSQAKMDFANAYQKTDGFDSAWHEYMRDNPIVNNPGGDYNNWELNTNRLNWSTYNALKNKGISDPNGWVATNGLPKDLDAIPQVGKPAWGQHIGSNAGGMTTLAQGPSVGANQPQGASQSQPAQNNVPKAISDNPAFRPIVDAYTSGKPVNFRGRQVKVTGFDENNNPLIEDYAPPQNGQK